MELFYLEQTMPKKPKRPCSYPGCPKLTDGRFCEEHAKAEARRYEKYQRDPGARKRYGKAWTFIRKTYAAEHPFCEVCLSEGRYTPTKAVLHSFMTMNQRNRCFSEVPIHSSPLTEASHEKLSAELRKSETLPNRWNAPPLMMTARDTAEV